MTTAEALAGLILDETFERENPAKGSHIHKLDAPAARRVAAAVVAAARAADVPLAYLAAAIRQESAFDPRAENRNLDRHPEGGLATTDLGMAQISGRNLVAMFPDLTDEERRTRAFDEVWAAGWMAGAYRTLLTWAKDAFPGSDPFYVATLAYNKGRTGAALIVRRRPDPKVKGYETLARVLGKEIAGRRHAWSVMRNYARFRARLTGGDA